MHYEHGIIVRARKFTSASYTHPFAAAKNYCDTVDLLGSLHLKILPLFVFSCYLSQPNWFIKLHKPYNSVSSVFSAENNCTQRSVLNVGLPGLITSTKTLHLFLSSIFPPQWRQDYVPNKSYWHLLASYCFPYYLCTEIPTDII